MKLLFSAFMGMMFTLFVQTAYAGTENHQKHGAHNKAIMITDVVIRQTTPQAGATAAYAIIHNHGSQDDRLIAASVSFAKKTEIHEMMLDGDVMKMRELEGGLLIPAGKTVTLASGAEHIMLMGLSQPITKDSSYEIIFEFESAGTMTVPAGTISLSGGHSHSHSHSESESGMKSHKH